MKRCILVNVRQNKDEKTGDELLFLTMYRLPTKMSNGNLWHPKKTEAVIVGCINKTKKPDTYDKYISVKPGALIDVTFGLNDFNNKTFVADLQLVQGTNNYTDNVLYL